MVYGMENTVTLTALSRVLDYRKFFLDLTNY